MNYTWAKPGKLIALAEVLERMGCSRPTLAKKLAAGQFPAPINAPGRRRWLETDLEDYMAGRSKVAA